MTRTLVVLAAALALAVPASSSAAHAAHSVVTDNKDPDRLVRRGNAPAPSGVLGGGTVTRAGSTS